MNFPEWKINLLLEARSLIVIWNVVNFLFIFRDVGEKEFDFWDWAHPVCHEKILLILHFDCSEIFTTQMHKTFFNRSAWLLHLYVNLLPRIANPTNIAQWFFSILVSNRIWSDWLDISNYAFDYGQWIIFILFRSHLQKTFIVDKAWVSLEMQPIYCLITFKCFTKQFRIFFINITEWEINMKQSFIRFESFN